MVALIFRILILGILDAFAIGSIPRVLSQHDALVTTIFFTVFIALNFVYFWPKAVAARWLAPGTTLLAIFVIIPVLINVVISGTNNSTGHDGTRQQAIVATVASSVQQDTDGVIYDAIAVHNGNQLGVLLTDQISGQVSLGTPSGNQIIENPKTQADGTLVVPDGWVAYGSSDAQQQEISDALSTLPNQQLAIPSGDNKFIVWDGANNPYNATAVVIYDKTKDRLVDTTTGYVYNEANGSFIGPKTPDFPNGEDMTANESWVGSRLRQPTHIRVGDIAMNLP